MPLGAQATSNAYRRARLDAGQGSGACASGDGGSARETRATGADVGGKREGGGLGTPATVGRKEGNAMPERWAREMRASPAEEGRVMLRLYTQEPREAGGDRLDGRVSRDGWCLSGVERRGDVSTVRQPSGRMDGRERRSAVRASRRRRALTSRATGDLAWTQRVASVAVAEARRAYAGGGRATEAGVRLHARIRTRSRPALLEEGEGGSGPMSERGVKADRRASV